jgi:hypothetical protein
VTREQRERRATFDQAADLYDRARPGYPRALFDDLAERRGTCVAPYRFSASP